MSDVGIIAFDYEGALELARRLSALADSLERAYGARTTAATTALAPWTGPFGREVAARLGREDDLTADTAAAMRSEADRWAAAWAEAIDDQNRLAYNAAVDDREAIGELAEFGLNPLVPPVPVPVPVGPEFAPTGGTTR